MQPRLCSQCLRILAAVKHAKNYFFEPDRWVQANQRMEPLSPRRSVLKQSAAPVPSNVNGPLDQCTLSACLHEQDCTSQLLSGVQRLLPCRRETRVNLCGSCMRLLGTQIAQDVSCQAQSVGFILCQVISHA